MHGTRASYIFLYEERPSVFIMRTQEFQRNRQDSESWSFTNSSRAADRRAT
jgi:hypothetical protein